MFKYVIELEYKWQNDRYVWNRSNQFQVTVIDSTVGSAVEKALKQTRSDGLRFGEWVLGRIVSVEELPEMIDPKVIADKDQYIEALQAEIDSLKDEIDSLHRSPTSFDLPELTRVAVISDEDVEFQTHGGMYDYGAWAAVQDDGKTLKIFPLYEGGSRFK